MLRHKRESIEWLEFELFQDFGAIVHASFLRHGGVSPLPYNTLNVGGGTGDTEQNIQANRALIQKVLGCSSLVGGHQVHGARVVEVPFGIEGDQCDGLLTRQPDLGLLIKHADCQAAIFYDPTLNVIGNVHAGWRGNVQNIYREAINELQRWFGCKPENIFVGISPSLGPCCAQFINYKTELPESFLEFQTKPFYFDLWEVARQQLMEAGILPHHLEIAKICTQCNSQDYFSHRREKPSGRHATVIAIKR